MLVLDVSSSMEGQKIAELNEGVRQFLQEIREDEFALHSVELGVVTFGGRVTAALEFAPLKDVVDLQNFSAFGNTPMGEAVNLAIDALEKRKNQYKRAGVSYHQPWLVLMTDGMPTDYSWNEAAQRLRQMADNKKAVVIGVAIGHECDMQTLAEFCPADKPPVRLSGLKFGEFFAWLSHSMSLVSQSTPGMSPDLPSIDGWADIET